MLVADLADEFLDDVLQGDDAGRAAVLVDDDGDGLLAAQPLQEGLHGQRLRDEQRGLGDPARRGCAAGRCEGTARASLRCTMPTISSIRSR